MTPQEANEILMTVEVKAPVDKADEYYRAIIVSREALEKQIPKKPTTNYERIKAMSVEEMASFWVDKIMQQECVLIVAENMSATVIEAVKRDIFRKCIRWLESEVQENG